MSKQNNPVVNITLNPNAVFVPLRKILEETSDNVLFGLRLIDSTDKLIDIQTITTENTFYSFQFAGNEKENISSSKEKFKYWMLKKGFEDLIKGVNLSLMAAYNYCSIIENKDNIKSYSQFQEKIMEFEKTASEQSLPGLLQKIKPKLKGELLFLDEIISINKVRNCLVHRNGIVTEKDINDLENEKLKVLYLKLRAQGKKNNGELFDIDKITLIPGGTEIITIILKDSKLFNYRENVKFNYQEFNDVLLTCFEFGSDLIQKLPDIRVKKNGC